jgi:hypothetical protein
MLEKTRKKMLFWFAIAVVAAGFLAFALETTRKTHCNQYNRACQ